MGQFYKATEADYIQNPIYQPPIELMARVLQTQDKVIDDTIEQNYKLYNAVDYSALSPDQARAEERANYLKGKIDDLTRDIQRNPMEYLRKRSEVDALAREVQTEMTTGELGRINSQKVLYDNWKKTQLERTKQANGRVRPEDIANIERAGLAMFANNGGTGYRSTNDYNQLNLEDVASYVDANDLADKYIKDFKAQEIEQAYTATAGTHNYDITQIEKGISPDRIRAGGAARLLTDPEFNAYWDQQERLGIVPQGTKMKVVNDAVEQAVNKYGVVNKSSKKIDKGLTPEAKRVQDLQDYKTKADYASSLRLREFQIKQAMKDNGDDPDDDLEDGSGSSSGGGSSRGGSNVYGSRDGIISMKEASDAMTEYSNEITAMYNTFRNMKNNPIPKAKDGRAADAVKNQIILSMQDAQADAIKRGVNPEKDPHVKEIRGVWEKLKNLENRALKGKQAYGWYSAAQLGYKKSQINDMKKYQDDALKANPTKFSNEPAAYKIFGKIVEGVSFNNLKDVKKSAVTEDKLKRAGFTQTEINKISVQMSNFEGKDLFKPETAMPAFNSRTDNSKNRLNFVLDDGKGFELEATLPMSNLNINYSR